MEDDIFTFAADLVAAMDESVMAPQWPRTAEQLQNFTPERQLAVAYQAGYRACVDRMKDMMKLGDEENREVDRIDGDEAEGSGDGPWTQRVRVLGEGSTVYSTAVKPTGRVDT